MKRRFLLLVVVIVAAASLLLRLPGLDTRPMHTDEAVQAAQFQALWHEGLYRYNPAEYHGPTLYYLTLPSVWLSGIRDFAHTNESTFRLVPLVFGLGLILLLPLIEDGLGRPAVILAAVLTAVSPAMAYYSRYYIQEMLLVFFTFGFLVCGWRYTRKRGLGWRLGMGACVGLMYATKETWVISLVSLLVAAVLASFWSRWRAGHHVDWKRRLPARTVVIAVGVALLVSTVLFSSFFTNARGPLDAILAYGHYVAKGAGDEKHVHAPGFYLGILTYYQLLPGPVWSEGVILFLAACGAAIALFAKRLPRGAHPVFLRIITFYTLSMTAIYSLIPYKTPWCLLGFLHGMILLAGFGGYAIVHYLPWRTLKAVAAILLVIGVYQLTGLAQLTTGRFQADRRNPYVYAHTGTDVFNLAERVEALAKVSPQGYDLPIYVYAADPWPLPWYLRRFSRVGYWTSVEEFADVPLLFVSTELDPKIQPYLKGREYQPEYYGLRPGSIVQTYIRQDLWDAYIKTLEAAQ